MTFKLNNNNRKRVFNLPCYIFDKYIKNADEAALKVILCLYSSDEEMLSINDICELTGISYTNCEAAIAFWKSNGEIIECDEVYTDVSSITASKPKLSKINLAEYTKANTNFKSLVSEAEKTLGRILTHYEKEALVILTDYYNFSAPAAILIFEHCAKSEYFSASYAESVASSMHSKGIITYEQLEQEFTKLDDIHSFEGEIKRALGLNAKLTKKQSEYIGKWRDLGFSTVMISLAGERCIDSTNKVSFPYID